MSHKRVKILRKELNKLLGKSATNSEFRAYKKGYTQGLHK